VDWVPLRARWDPAENALHHEALPSMMYLCNPPQVFTERPKGVSMRFGYERAHTLLTINTKEVVNLHTHNAVGWFQKPKKEVMK
jgi:hypothetical protein